MFTNKYLLLLPVFLALLLSSCGLLPARQTEDPSVMETQIAEEVFKQQTIQAAFTRIAEQTQQAFFTATPTFTPTITPTPTPTATPLPPTRTATQIILPTATRVPPTPIPCDWAAFVKDVTIKDGTQIEVGKSFTKTWRLKNKGTCTWNREYALVFVEGNRMNGPEVQFLENQVKPGQTVDLSVKLKAPTTTGTHTGYWMLRDENGRLFGLGKKANDPFWVKIKAVNPPPTPTNTLVPTPTATSQPPPCLRAEFVADITVPDNSIFPPGQPFTKIWRFKNTGFCTWSSNFAVIFVNGNQMSGPNFQYLDREVRPGNLVDVALNLVAPLQPGEHRGDWMFRDSNGAPFGIGAKGDKSFWIRIRVEEISQSFFNFYENYCAAEWKSRRGALNCPHWENPTQKAYKDEGPVPLKDYQDGFFSFSEAPNLETTLNPGGPVLVVRPDNEADGFITASFPALSITNQHRFKAVIGCMKENPDCDVTFQINYRLQDEPVQVLAFWRQRNDGEVTNIDIDLSFLAGNPVWFDLVVVNNGDSSQDWAFWLQPRIVKVEN